MVSPVNVTARQLIVNAFLLNLFKIVYNHTSQKRTSVFKKKVKKV
nr:MAG TPA: hypothetical protein [Caudoviricetes sp.]